MLGPIAVLLSCQLIGEVTARTFGVPVPGPVIGLGLFFAVISARPDVVDVVGPTARGILAHLSLLFVPAGVGVVGNLDLFGRYWPQFAVILVLSTLITMLVSVGTFLLVLRVMGAEDD